MKAGKLKKCYVYLTKKNNYCNICNRLLISFNNESTSRIGKTFAYPVKYCEKCDVYYVKYELYKAHKTEWVVINQSTLNYYITLDENEKKEEKNRTQVIKTKNSSGLKYEFDSVDTTQRIDNGYRFDWQIRARYRPVRDTPERQWINTNEKTKSENSVNIGPKDFLIRRGSFKCKCNGHLVENIDASVSIINRNGTITQKKVAAGYCDTCKVYFIMESTYQNLRMMGVPICRISDEKTYLSNNGSSKGLKLAQESILKQYGYNVSQQEDLTDQTRQMILASLVDYGILTRTEIISYLDFFINQRKNMDIFEVAISKWKEDRQFITQYKTGSYTTVKVKGIYRR